MARAMTDAAKLGAGGDAEFWNERAGKLLASLLHAAALSGRSMSDVRLWVLRHELDRPATILESRHADLAAQILDSLDRAGERALSSTS